MKPRTGTRTSNEAPRAGSSATTVPPCASTSARDRQAQPGAACRASARLLGSREPLEELVAERGREPRSLAVDSHHDRAGPRADGHGHGAARRGVTHRVIDEVVEYLAQPIRVALDLGLRDADDGQGHAVRSGTPRERGGALPRERREVAAEATQVQVPGFGPAQREQRVDESRHPLHLGPARVQRGAIFRNRTIAPQGHVDRAAQVCKRRATASATVRKKWIATGWSRGGRSR